MKRKIFNIIIIFILAIMLFANVSRVQATAIVNEGSSFAGAIGAAEDFLNTERSKIINYQGLYNVINYFYNIVMIIAIILSIIVGISIGIRIIYGSIDEKADAKHLIVPYLFIVTIIAFSLTIWKFLLSLFYNSI